MWVSNGFPEFNGSLSGNFVPLVYLFFTMNGGGPLTDAERARIIRNREAALEKARQRQLRDAGSESSAPVGARATCVVVPPPRPSPASSSAGSSSLSHPAVPAVQVTVKLSVLNDARFQVSTSSFDQRVVEIFKTIPSRSYGDSSESSSELLLLSRRSDANVEFLLQRLSFTA